MTPACMGGWCRHRDECALHLQEDRRQVAERLCALGLEVPVNPHKPAARIVRIADLMAEVAEAA